MKRVLRLRTTHIEAYVDATGEVELSKPMTSGSAAVSGRGHGDLNELRHVWECILTWCASRNVTFLWCQPTCEDGRGPTRRRVYSRVGFIDQGHYTMTLDLREGGEKNDRGIDLFRLRPKN